MKPFLIILFLLPLSAFAQNYQVGDNLNVNARSGLNMRDAANLTGKKVGFLEYGQKVEVISKEINTQKLVIENLEGSWVLVKSGEVKGFVFDGFLTKLPVVDLRSEDEDSNGCLIDEIKNYAFQKLTVSNKTQYLDFSDTFRISSLEIFDLINGHQFIIGQFYEAENHEIQLESIRRSEGFTLVRSFLQNCNLLNDEVEKTLKSKGVKKLYDDVTYKFIGLSWYKNRMSFYIKTGL